ncbi:aldehyde dehydrogenase [uncultured Roseibium sp.]|uniref:aldehyde dehydrogenase n=1 Tax=uncultured Roseibium sp. TaxID=1936171 RepID=UPI00259726BB|nr:aldehyde dehydrogenase [uncultured Roseibium sp.]
MELTHQDWVERAKAIEFPRHALIDGQNVDAVSGKTFDTINPATGEVLTRLPACDAADVDKAVQAARRAFEDRRWSGKSPAERKAVLLRLSTLILENQAELALLDSLDMGKLVRDAATIDVPGAAAIFQWYGEAIDKIYDEIAPTGSSDLAMVRREALGVVAAVVPWNFPLDMATWKCAPALAMGNSVILKPAEQSPLSALRLAELAREAGLPDGVLNVVTGYGETAGKAIGLHPDIDCIAFTGSTEVGKYFLEYSGQSNMKQVWLECGGKSPNLVFADCDDLDKAAEMAAFGIFFNQGEVCTANSRLLLEKSISDEFLERLVEKAKGFSPGNPLDPASAMGAIVDEGQTTRIMSYIEHGRATCTLLHGGNRQTVSGKGCFVEPTIFSDVAPDNRLAVEEIFGPVLAVTTFESEDEAIAIANDTIYGLAASVWTSNLSRAHRVSSKLRAGTVSVNTVDALSPMTPFGGFKQSGIGRDLSLHAFDKFSALKTTWIKLKG